MKVMTIIKYLSFYCNFLNGRYFKTISRRKHRQILKTISFILKITPPSFRESMVFKHVIKELQNWKGPYRTCITSIKVENSISKAKLLKVQTLQQSTRSTEILRTSEIMSFISRHKHYKYINAPNNFFVYKGSVYTLRVYKSFGFSIECVLRKNKIWYVKAKSQAHTLIF